MPLGQLGGRRRGSGLNGRRRGPGAAARAVLRGCLRVHHMAVGAVHESFTRTAIRRRSGGAAGGGGGSEVKELGKDARHQPRRRSCLRRHRRQPLHPEPMYDRRATGDGPGQRGRCAVADLLRLLGWTASSLTYAIAAASVACVALGEPSGPPRRPRRRWRRWPWLALGPLGRR